MSTWSEAHWHDLNHTPVNGMPRKAVPQSPRPLPCFRGSIASSPHCLNRSSLLELKDGPASCWLCQGPSFKDWLVRIHLPASGTYCSILNIKLGSKLPSVDKNIFGLWCNVKWHSGTQVIYTFWFYLWKEKFCRKRTERNHASMVAVVAPTVGTLGNL